MFSVTLQKSSFNVLPRGKAIESVVQPRQLSRLTVSAQWHTLKSCTPLPKAAKPVWAKQLTRLPCLVLYVKFQFVYTTRSLTKPIQLPNSPYYSAFSPNSDNVLHNVSCKTDSLLGC